MRNSWGHLASSAGEEETESRLITVCVFLLRGSVNLCSVWPLTGSKRTAWSCVREVYVGYQEKVLSKRLKTGTGFPGNDHDSKPWAWQSSSTCWKCWGCAVQGQELDFILVGPFQLRIVCDFKISLMLPTVKNCEASRKVACWPLNCLQVLMLSRTGQPVSCCQVCFHL